MTHWWLLHVETVFVPEVIQQVLGKLLDDINFASYPSKAQWLAMNPSPGQTYQPYDVTTRMQK